MLMKSRIVIPLFIVLTMGLICGFSKVENSKSINADLVSSNYEFARRTVTPTPTPVPTLTPEQIEESSDIWTNYFRTTRLDVFYDDLEELGYDTSIIDSIYAPARIRSGQEWAWAVRRIEVTSDGFLDVYCTYDLFGLKMTEAVQLLINQYGVSSSRIHCYNVADYNESAPDELIAPSLYNVCDIQRYNGHVYLYGYRNGQVVPDGLQQFTSDMEEIADDLEEISSWFE